MSSLLKNKSMKKYFYYVIAASVLYGISPTNVSMAFSYGCNEGSVAFWTLLMSLPVYLILIRRFKPSLKLTRSQAASIFALGLTSVSTNLLLWQSYQYLSSGMSTIVHFAYPSLITLIMLVVFRSHFSARKIAALFLSFFGIILISRSDWELSRMGIAYALSSALTWAIYVIMLDRSPVAEMDVWAAGLYAHFIQVPIALIYCLATNSFVVPQGPCWFFLIAEVFVLVAGFCLLQIGVEKIGAFSSGIISAMEPITAFLISAIIFQVQFETVQFIGAVIVILAVLIDSLHKPANNSNIV